MRCHTMKIYVKSNTATATNNTNERFCCSADTLQNILESIEELSYSDVKVIENGNTVTICVNGEEYEFTSNAFVG